MIIKLKKILFILSRKLFTYDKITILRYCSGGSLPKRSIKIVRVNESNLKDVLNFNSVKYIDVFMSFLKAGDVGYYGYIDGSCIHRSWVIKGENIVYPHWGLPMILTDKQVFIHFCETSEQARGKGVYPAVLSKITQEFSHENDVLISINSSNHSSIRGALKANFFPQEEFLILFLFGFKYTKKRKLIH